MLRLVEMQSDKTKVQYLSEALPYIQKYSGKVFVVKYGGSALTKQSIAQSTINDLVLLNSVGIKIVLVHGGGPEINEMLSKLGMEVKFENGLRVTSPETMEIVEMVLHGKVQRRLVTMINCAGARAIGLSGRDGRIVVAKQHSGVADNNMVGDIETTNLKLINQIHELNLIPVISSIAPDESGKVYNINADTMTAEIAAGLGAAKMLLMTDTPGVLENKNDPNSLIRELKLKDCKSMIANGKADGGMIPKLESCIKALEHGVSEAIILNGTQEHSLLLEVFTDIGSGTRITL